MDNRRIADMPEDDTSEYITDGRENPAIDFGGLFSGEFVNIELLYRSEHGPAELWKATRYGRQYVLKGLKAIHREDPIYNLRLAKEFEIGMMLDHPNIRGTLGMETVEGPGRVIVLEYVDGVGLDTLISDGRLSKEEAREVAIQIASALNYVHRKQILHRDLKPANILVSHNGNHVKLIDFNLADGDEFIVLKNPAGSRGYTAPELIEKKTKPSVLSDIYSFGKILEALAAATDDELLRESGEECCNSDPSKRPQSVARIPLPASNPGFKDKIKLALSSKKLTYVLLGICLSLAGAILYEFIK